MQRLKLMTVVGTRPELIKLSSVIPACDRAFEHVLVHTGQNYDFELNGVFFEELEIRRPDHFLEAAGTSAMSTIGNVLERTDALLAEVRPDAFLLLGDTNSCLSVIAAKRRRVPTFHMEAGNRCFDDRVPEEVNRRIVDHTSDINLVYTEHARQYLLREGLPPQRVIKTGSPMREVLRRFAGRIEASAVLAGLGLEPHRYIVASFHREENVDDPGTLRSLVATLERLVHRHGLPVIVSTHPRTRARLGSLGQGAEQGEQIRFMKPQGFFDYVRLQQQSFCVLSDSGTLTEEAAIMGFPAVMIRQAHERPEGMDEAVAVMSGLDPDRIMEAVALATSPRPGERRLVADYAPLDVSEKVVRIVLSYTDYVNRTVWQKQPGPPALAGPA
jgi:UDP-N-acetylglucosamine 2-epimerase (non-hydrolysing)